MIARTDMEIALQKIGNNPASVTKPSGSTFIDDDADHVGPYQALLAMTDAELDVTSCSFGEGMQGYNADFIIPKGVTIFGDFQTVSLGSGSIIAYKL